MRSSLWWLSLLVSLFVLLPFIQPRKTHKNKHTYHQFIEKPEFRFTNKPEYRLYLSPPFLYNNKSRYDIYKDDTCHQNEMKEHGAEVLIPHLLHQIGKMGEEGFPFRHNLSKIKIVSTPEQADLIIIQSRLKEIFQKETTKREIEHQFSEHVKKIPSKCNGCDFVLIMSSGGCLGLRSMKKVFPRMIFAGVDGGNMIQKTKFESLTIPIPYPFTPCNDSSPEFPTYPLSSPLDPRRRFLFFYSVSAGKKPLNTTNTLPINPTPTKKSNFSRTTAVDSINFQAEQKGLGDDIIYVKRVRGSYSNWLDVTDFVSDSDFCLCPRGTTPASQRMVHVASLGCIPVILSDDYVPPFSAYIAPFYVQIKQDEVGTLLDRLMALKEEDVRQLKMNLEKYVQAWMWTWQPNANNRPLDLFLHQLFALGDLNLWMYNRNTKRKGKEIPFENKKENFLLPSSLEKKVANFYFSLVNMPPPRPNLSVPLTLPPPS